MVRWPQPTLHFSLAPLLPPEALIAPPQEHETFTWVKQPEDGRALGKWYGDGSRLDAQWDLSGMCARHGWAVAAFNDGLLTAAAHGRPPAWAHGIYGAELWSLLMAAMSAEPGAPFRVDCLAVQQGTLRGVAWATAPDRMLARAWGPLASALDGETDRVAWMPAHCTHAQVGIRTLSDGSLLTEGDVDANAFVDGLAKEAARADRVPAPQRSAVRALGRKLTAIAKWIGQVTVRAGSFPDPSWAGVGKQGTIRDTSAVSTRAFGRKPARIVPIVASHPVHEFGSACPRWVAVRQRIAAKEAARGTAE
jgi:hypothetical protein